MSSETSVQFAGMLPDPDVSVHCNQWAKELGIIPAGTAIAADLVVLVEVPLPWPKPVSVHELLKDIMPLAMPGPVAESQEGASQVSTKILAAVPKGFSVGIRVTAFRRTPSGSIRSVAEASGTEELKRMVDQLIAGQPLMNAIDESNPPTQSLLVCTQGSHDVCCGADGTRFARAVEEALPDVEVHRVSHTGGHRFAPTAMSFPSGRMWAHLTTEMAQQIFSHTGEPAELAAFSRGWWGAPVGYAQVAEQAVFAQAGWDWSATQRSVTTEMVGDTHARCVVESTAGTWEMDVKISRLVPTIACREPGGLPVKPGREYAVSNLEQRSS